MPFLSKDWRSPGEEWIRYEGGWEKRKTVILVPRPDIDSENKVSNQLLIKYIVDLSQFIIIQYIPNIEYFNHN